MAYGDGGILDPSVHENFIREYARQKGVNPDWVAAVAAAEGMHAWSENNPNAGSHVDVNSGQPFSFGDFQLNVHGGLGNQALAQGIDPRDPNQWQAADKFAIDYIARTRDLSPWKGDPVAAEYIRRYGTGNPGAAATAATASTAAPTPPVGPVFPATPTAQNAGHVDVNDLNPAFSPKLAALQAALAKEGIHSTIISGYRSPEYQQQLINQGVHPAAQPWQSFHQYGLAADLHLDNGNYARMWELAPQFGLHALGAGDAGHVQMGGGNLSAVMAANNVPVGWRPGGQPAPASAIAAATPGAGAGTGDMPTMIQPPSPGRMAMNALGQGLAAFGESGGATPPVPDTPDPAPIRTPALSGFEMPQQPNYLGMAASSSLPNPAAGADSITLGAPSMSAMAAGEPVGTGSPMTGIGAMSPLTFPTSLARYSRVG